MSEEAELESAILALLGRLLAEEIDAELLEVLHTSGIAEIFEDIEPGCLKVELNAATAEYQRLFTPPEGKFPVASNWASGSDDGEIVELVEDIEATLGLNLPRDLPLDHASVLLPLMGWLVENQPTATSQFFEVAFKPWLSQFAAALSDNAELPIYRATARLLAEMTE